MNGLPRYRIVLETLVQDNFPLEDVRRRACILLEQLKKITTNRQAWCFLPIMAAQFKIWEPILEEAVAQGEAKAHKHKEGLILPPVHL